MGTIEEMLIRCYVALSCQRVERDERGDVPGWVMVAVMTIRSGGWVKV